ncbi:glycosyltransferase [Antarcticimicrobium sediminis]|uniref:Rhamnosyl transferase n=1 Tax=Antarcticimicrobium sediminis TaxID=2546227 RepID=A0A4R5EW27_9RHOB|nr:glycosyltransferase [Antarcticimicrobium sediminis]TDE39124.1 hypothetical protein E1B25_08980 [Antarcticimicrobium sediminis]
MDRKIKTVGLLRFSVLTPTYYSERFKTLEDTAAHLFAPERMALRFRLFEQLCLPALTGQTDPDFDMVVLTAETMPEQYLERLVDLIEPLPNIHCLTVGTENHYKLLQRGYNAVPKDDCTHRIMFRLDDDDALDKNFVKRTKRLASGLLKLNGPKTPFVIAYNRGFYVRSTGAETEVFDACERAPLSAGTTLVAPVDHPANPYRFNHRKLAQHFNTYSDIMVPAFIRTIHGDNKSNPAQMGLTHKLRDDQIEPLLQTHFDMTLDRLRAL